MLSAIDPGSAGVGALAVSAMATVALAAIKLVGAKGRNGRNGKAAAQQSAPAPLPPGAAPVCQKRGEDLARLDTTAKATQQSLIRIESRLSKVDEKVDQVLLKG